MTLLSERSQPQRSCLWTYSDDGTLNHVPSLAKKTGFAVVVLGIFDIKNLDQLARAEAEVPFVDAYRVGNEGIHFGRYTEADLLAARDRLHASTGRPLTTSEPFDDLANRPSLRAMFDFVSANTHPYYLQQQGVYEPDVHGLRIPESAYVWTLERYRDLRSLAGGKFVYFSEVGLPTSGDPEVSEDRQRLYYQYLIGSEVKFAYFEPVGATTGEG